MRGTRLRKVWACVAVVGAAAAGCHLGSRWYEVRGQVLGVDAERQEVLLKHEDVPGLMSAMTMPFRTRDRKWLDGLRAGDMVQAQLVVRGADAYLTSLVRVGSAAIETETAAASGAAGFNLLKAGEPVPASS